MNENMMAEILKRRAVNGLNVRFTSKEGEEKTMSFASVASRDSFIERARRLGHAAEVDAAR